MATSELYTNTVIALNASLSSTTTKADREACDRFFQQLKESRDCLPILSEVVTQDHNEFIKLLAISILNDWIKLWWNKVSESDQLSIRTMLINILASPMGVSKNKSIRTKLAVMLTNIAQRQFPQQWPTLIEEFINIWSNSPAERQEIIIMAIEFIITDCIDSDFNNTLPTIRRQEIVAGLKEKQELILSTSFNSLASDLNSFCSNFGSEASTQSQQLVEATAKMLIPLSALIKPEEICVAPHEFSSLLFEMLKMPQMQVHAIEILHTISQQKLTIEVLSLFLMGFQRLGVLTTSPSDLQEGVQFQRSYATCMLNVLSNNISWVFDKKLLGDVAAASCLNSYIQILLEFLKSPSKRLAADLIKDFIKILKDDLVLNMPSMEKYAMSILSEYMKRCKKPTEAELEADELHEIEFEDAEEWIEFSGTLKSQIKALSDVITSRYTLTTMHTLTGFLRSLIAGVQTIPAGGASVAQAKSAIAEFEVFYNIYSPLFHYILPTSSSQDVSHSSSPSEAARLQEIHSCMLQVVQALYGWMPTDDLMLCEKFRQLQSHAVVLNQLPIEYTVKVFEMLFESILSYINVTTAAGGTEQNPVDNNKRLLCIKVTGFLAQFSHACAERLVQSPYIQTLLNQVNTVLSSPLIQANNTMQSSLRETLIGLAEYVQDVSLKTQIFTLALSEIVMKLTANTGEGSYTAVFSNEESLLKSMLAYCQNNKHFVDIRSLINTIYLTAKRIKNPALPIALYEQDLVIDLNTFKQQFPFSEVWLTCLPSLFQGVKVLHSLWAPSTRQLLYSEWQKQGFKEGIDQSDLYYGLYIPSISDTLKMTSGGTANSGNSSGGESGKQTNGQKIHWELREVRIYLYQVLAQAAAHKAIYLSPDLPAFLNTIASQLEYMENYQLSIFVRYFLEGFIVHALPSAFPVVANFLATFLSKSLMRINIAWDRSNDLLAGRDWRHQAYCVLLGDMLRDDKIFFAYNYHHCSIVPNVAASTVSAEEYETIRDGCVSEVSRSYCDLLSSFCSLRGQLMIIVATTGAAAVATPAAVAENAMKSARTASLHKLFFGPAVSAVTTQFIANIISCLCLPDGSICRKMLALVDHLIVMSVEDARLIPVVGKEAFRACLYILLRQEKWSVGLEWELIDILLDCYVLYVLGEKSIGAAATLNPQAASKNSPTKDGWNANPFNNGKGGKGGTADAGGNKGNGAAATIKRNKMISDAPLKVLMEVPGVTKQKIDKLDNQLLTTLQKKKRRALFKDFVTEIIQVNGQASSSGGSVFAQPTSQIQDIRNRLLIVSKSKKSTAGGEFNVAGLFEDNDL